MHMADALISPAVGGAMLAVTAGLAVYSASKVKEEMDEKKIPLMGVMGAFVFAAPSISDGYIQLTVFQPYHFFRCKAKTLSNAGKCHFSFILVFSFKYASIFIILNYCIH